MRFALFLCDFRVLCFISLVSLYFIIIPCNPINYGILSRVHFQLVELDRHARVPVGALVKQAAHIVRIMNAAMLMRIKSRPN